MRSTMYAQTTPETYIQKATASPLRRYGVAVWLGLLALLLTLLLQQPMQQNPQSPFLLFFAAVLVSAWYGGFGPAPLSIFFFVVARFFLFLSRGFLLVFFFDSPPRFGIFFLVGLPIFFLCSAR